MTKGSQMVNPPWKQTTDEARLPVRERTNWALQVPVTTSLPVELAGDAPGDWLGAKTPSPGTNHKNRCCRRSLLPSPDTTRRPVEAEEAGKNQTFLIREKDREKINQEPEQGTGGFYWWDWGGLGMGMGGRNRMGFGPHPHCWKASNLEVMACHGRVLAAVSLLFLCAS